MKVSSLLIDLYSQTMFYAIFNNKNFEDFYHFNQSTAKAKAILND